MAILSSIPQLPTLDMERSIAFYTSKMGFSLSATFSGYAMLQRDGVDLHLWYCEDPAVPESTGCYFRVDDVQKLYLEFAVQELVHPDGHLEDKPWGMREFAVLDDNGNLLRFGEEKERDN
ncbi:MAG: VOC family protein [Saprospiraceae bacterium]